MSNVTLVGGVAANETQEDVDVGLSRNLFCR